MGWRAGQKSLLLLVAGEVFLLTLPFIERRNQRSPATRLIRSYVAPLVPFGETGIALVSVLCSSWPLVGHKDKAAAERQPRADHGVQTVEAGGVRS